MRELKATGFMSNRGRQNVASFLALDCNNDWRAGGDWFETNLLDYDVYSNWVVSMNVFMASLREQKSHKNLLFFKQNWCAAAGMTGGRVNRFNIAKQSKDYDQYGDYVRLWLPELATLPNQFIHEPWKMNQFQQAEYGVRLGVDYPGPIIPPFRPYTGGADEGRREDRRRTDKQPPRKPNSSGKNRHQRHEMKSVKTGQFDIR
jgi:deoxyribodipyrimidine photo-lyase